MEKRRFNFKVLCTLVALPFTFMMAILLTACADKNYSAKFDKEEYVLSIGQKVDITKDISLENITLQDLYFNSSEKNIVTVEVTNPLDSLSAVSIKGLASGSATIYVYLRGETLDTIDITVKNQFATPTNIAVDESGLISWDKVSCMHEGKQVDASYNVFVSTDGKTGETISTTQNSYQLPARGRYYISVQAVGTKYIDSSESSPLQELYFQSVRAVTNLKFENIDDGLTQKGIVSWNSVDGADYYNVVIGESIKVDTSSYEFDLSSLPANFTIRVSACSLSEGYVDSPVEQLQIKKLALTGVAIVNGAITWDKNDNANAYIVHYENMTNSLIRGNLTTSKNIATLDDIPAGAYSVSIQALGQDNGQNKIFYANSERVVLSGNVAKLATPEFEYEINGNEVNFKASTTSSVIKKLLVQFKEEASGKVIEKTIDVPTTAVDGKYSVSDSVVLQEVGKYVVTAKALSTGINTIDQDGKPCSKVLNSAGKNEVTIYKLPTVGTINHSYDGDFNSTFSFPKPVYEQNYSGIALDYDIKINGETATIAEKKLSSLGNYLLSIGKINNRYENPAAPLSFEVLISTKLASVEAGVEYIGATSSKTLSKLTVTTMEKEGAELTSNYIYNAGNNANGFKYSLYKTTSSFAERGELVESQNDSYGSMRLPRAGYYIVDIVAYSKDPNNYLNGEGSDTFFVKEALATPVLNFGETTTKLENPSESLDLTALSGYYLEINAVESAETYEIQVGGTKVATVADGDKDGKVYYYFESAYDFASGSTEVTVVAKGSDDNIYVSSSKQIIITKLESVSGIVQNEQSLEFKYIDGDLNFFKNAVVEANRLDPTPSFDEGTGETTYTLDVSSVTTDFDLVVFATKTDVPNTQYYIDSEVQTYKIHKVATMTNFLFSRDKVYFTYNDENDYLAIAQGVRNNKISLIATVSLHGESLATENFEIEIQDYLVDEGSKEFSFELMDVIDQLSIDNENFASLYVQRSSIRFSLVVRASFYQEDRATYVFSSQNAISEESATIDYVSIEKISKPTLVFSESEKKISWEEENPSIYEYEILINDAPTGQSPVYDSSAKKYNFDLSTYFTQGMPTVIKMRKSADNYLDSDWSNEVLLYFLSAVSTLNITTDEDGKSVAKFVYYDALVDNESLTISINDDPNIDVTSDPSFMYYEFELSETTISYVVCIDGYSIEQANGDVAYFVGVESEPFVLTKLQEVVATEEFNFGTSSISWTPYAQVDTPRYQVNFEKDGEAHAKVSVEDTTLSLNNSTLALLEKGTYDVSVYAVNKNFNINAGQTGFYGGTIISTGTVVKLDEVEELELSLDETSTTIAGELAQTLTLSWVFDGEHHEDASIKFEVYINDAPAGIEVSYVDGQTDYSIEIDSTEMSEFNNTIKVVVKSDKDINSNSAEIAPYRFSAPTLSISDSKILTIDYSVVPAAGNAFEATNGFIVRVEVDGSIVREFKTLDSEVDLSSIFASGEYSGDYEISVVIKGITGYAVYSVEPATLTGTLLEKPTLTRNSAGFAISSSDEDVNYVVNILKEGEVIIENAIVVDGQYNLPDNLLDGSYVAEVVATKSGDLTSNKATLDVVLSRVSDISTFNMTTNRNRGGVTYTFSWNSVTNLAATDKYTLSFYEEDGTLIVSRSVNTATVALTNADLYAIIPTAGTYKIGIKANGDITNGYSSSKETIRNIVFESPITEITITNNGKISWEGSGDYSLFFSSGATQVARTSYQTNAQSIGGGRYQYFEHLDNTAGEVAVSISKIGLASMLQNNPATFRIDSSPKSQTFTKLQDIEDIYLNNGTGEIQITTTETFVEDITIFFEYTDDGGTVHTYSTTEFAVNGNVYSKSFVEIYDNLGIGGNGLKEVVVYIYQENKLRSDGETFEFDFVDNETQDVSPLRAEDPLHDYLVVKSYDDREIKQLYLKITNEAGETTYLTLDAAAKRGYWNTFDDHNVFGGSEDVSANTSELAYAILMNDLTELEEAGKYKVQLAYVYETATSTFSMKGFNSELEYIKLSMTYDPTIANGKIMWELYPSDYTQYVTGYYVSFTNEEGSKNTVYISSADTREINPTHIQNSLDRYKVSVVNVNQDSPLVLASKEVTRNEYIIKTENLAQATKMNGGVLSMSLLRDGSDESYGTIAGEVAEETEIPSTDLPYGYGRYYEALDTNLQFVEGGGTFTAVTMSEKTYYIRTAQITKVSASVYKIQAGATIYSKYNSSIEDYYDANKFAKPSNFTNAFSKATFTYPFVYTLAGLKADENFFTLSFKTESGKLQNLTINAKNIIVDGGDVLYTKLKAVVDAYDSNYTGYSTIKDFVTVLEDATLFTGLATKDNLFDDIGESDRKGESIQAGVYDLYISQKGFEVASYDFATKTTPTLYVLTTEPTLICEDCEVASSPSVLTYRELNEDGYTYSYFLKFSPTTSNGTMITNYTLSMCYKMEMEEKWIYTSKSITFDGTNWKLAGKVIDTVVDGLETYVMLPLNGENGLNASMSKDKIYTLNIYANGNATRFNSKTEPIEISFLDFDKNIGLTTKGFEWFAFENDGRYYSTTVVYKLNNETSTRMTVVPSSAAVRRFSPTTEGLYDYILFMTPGSINKYSVTVDSDIYRVENVYKLYTPQVSIAGEGAFKLENNVNNHADYTPVYEITNNISQTTPETQDLSKTTTEGTYVAGTVAGGIDAYKETENSATMFNFTLQGSDVSSFAITSVDGGKFKLMGYAGEILYLSSAANSVNALMLKDAENISINLSGNLQWNPVEKSHNGTLSAEFNDDVTTIVYKIVVEYFYETGSVDAEGNPVYTQDGDKTDVFYTKVPELASDYIVGADESKEYIYKATVYAFACQDDDSFEGVLTSINHLYNINPTYVGESKYVLKNKGSSFEFTRLNDVTDIVIKDGKITWKSEYRNLDEYEFTVRYQGSSTSGILNGTYVYDPANANYVFTIDESEELLSSGETYTISVVVTAKSTTDKMTSFISSTSGVNILPKITSRQVKNTNAVVGGKSVDTYDIKQYFIDYASALYSKEVEVVYIITAATGNVSRGAFTLYYNSEASQQTSFEVIASTGSVVVGEPKIYLPSGAKLEIMMNVVTTSENYLNSYTYALDLERKGFADLDAITYDRLNNKFSWTYGKQTEYYLTAGTSLYTNSSCTNNTGIVLEAGRIITVLGQSSTSYQIWYDANGDGIQGGGETRYILKTNVATRSIMVEPAETVYYNVYITYLSSYTSGVTRTDTYSTRIYNNVTDRFFFVELDGVVVTEFKIQAREGEKNLYSDWLAFNCPTDAANQIKLTMFAGGEGTAENPYLIETAEQFKNMELLGAKPSYLTEYTLLTQQIKISVNTGNVTETGEVVETSVSGLDSKYYFRLENDITLESDGEFIIENFPSVFDGNGHTITYKSSSAKDLGTTQTLSYAKGTDSRADATFNRFNSIIRNLTATGEIKNVKLAIEYTYVPEATDTATLFAGMVLINSGLVQGVEVSSMKVNATNEIVSVLAIGGIVGINYATVTECGVNAIEEIKVENTQTLEQVLLFGGIVGFNVGNDALISLGYVSETTKINVRMSRSGNGITQAGGIAISNTNGASIIASGNIGEVIATSLAGTGYAAGVVIYTNGGGLYDCFNTGDVKGTEGYYGGIGYLINSNIGNLYGVGKVNGRTQISNFHIAGVFLGTKDAACYTRYSIEQTVEASAITSSRTTTTKLTGVTMVVTVDGSTYTITFTK